MVSHPVLQPHTKIAISDIFAARERIVHPDGAGPGHMPVHLLDPDIVIVLSGWEVGVHERELHPLPFPVSPVDIQVVPHHHCLFDPIRAHHVDPQERNIGS